MEKKTIFLELPAETLDKIDRENVMGDKSVFITHRLKRQLENNLTTMNASTELISRMDEVNKHLGLSGEINIVSNMGQSLGKFDINTIEGFF